ncbi:MAG: TerB family tellurite resistance protein [Rhodospirillales bacterium]|nr:TerB family tellurite resistance protein [Rhodospirillales bacterium]
MSIWGKIIGGVAGFAIGGPLGALLGAFAGHQIDKSKIRQGAEFGAGTGETRQVAFTVAVIVLSAKMAKADGVVTRDEIAAFKRMLHIPPSEREEVGRLFNEAKADAKGFEPYAQQIGHMFAHQPAVLEELMGVLFHIAKADGVVAPAEIQYLQQVAHIFGFDADDFERILATHTDPTEADPYQVLGITRNASDGEIKKAYLKLIKENHPDTLIAQGLPQEFIDLANEKMAAINVAYDHIEKERGNK